MFMMVIVEISMLFHIWQHSVPLILNMIEKSSLPLFINLSTKFSITQHICQSIYNNPFLFVYLSSNLFLSSCVAKVSWEVGGHQISPVRGWQQIRRSENSLCSKSLHSKHSQGRAIIFREGTGSLCPSLSIFWPFSICWSQILSVFISLAVYQSQSASLCLFLFLFVCFSLWQPLLLIQKANKTNKEALFNIITCYFQGKSYSFSSFLSTLKLKEFQYMYVEYTFKNTKVLIILASCFNLHHSF